MSASSEQILQGAPTLGQLWANEALDRLDAYDRGELRTIDVEEVFEQMDERDAH